MYYVNDGECVLRICIGYYHVNDVLRHVIDRLEVRTVIRIHSKKQLGHLFSLIFKNPW